MCVILSCFSKMVHFSKGGVYMGKEGFPGSLMSHNITFTTLKQDGLGQSVRSFQLIMCYGFAPVTFPHLLTILWFCSCPEFPGFLKSFNSEKNPKSYAY